MKNRIASGALSEILILTSYPPRECGIATYSQDLLRALKNKFSYSFTIKICALEANGSTFQYPDEVKYTLKTSVAADYGKLATTINLDPDVKIVLVQHEFGFYMLQEQAFENFLHAISKPLIIAYHSVLPHPDKRLKFIVRTISDACVSVIVMTHTSAGILMNEYGIPEEKIKVIAHGTHLVLHLDEQFLKKKYGLAGRKVLTTFGLLSSGKSIETTLEALPAIIHQCPEITFLIIGKTHPEVVKSEGEKYRESLWRKVAELNLQDHVVFINSYLPLPDLLEYLQLTDIYLFTTSDPNQAVSGTFSYAMSCACPIISTPIPHAKEVLTADTGILFDFFNSQQLADGVIRLLNDEPLRRSLSSNTLQTIVSTAWENSAVLHALLFEKTAGDAIAIVYDLPPIRLNHLKHLTTGKGIIQFSKINQPDTRSGYTLDDNARALVATSMYYAFTMDKEILGGISVYLKFIAFCQQPGGSFYNYVNYNNTFTDQNKAVNLDDANGRAVWALGYLLSQRKILPVELISLAETILENVMPSLRNIYSTRAMAFTIKGLCQDHSAMNSPGNKILVKTLADRLVQMYRHESNVSWKWFEGYLTYANSILPESLLYAWLMLRDPAYKEIALESFDFLLAKTFNDKGIEVISNRTWMKKGEDGGQFGQQPIDVAYTIMTLSKFYDIFMADDYMVKRIMAFDWFLGNNRLRQIVYNPCTSGCYDGMEETHVNLNQGAESTISYLLARLVMEKYKNSDNPLWKSLRKHDTKHTRNRKHVYSTNRDFQHLTV